MSHNDPREDLAKASLKDAFDRTLYGWVMTDAPASIQLYQVRAFRKKVHDQIDELVEQLS